MYIIKQNQTHRCREQISSYQWGEGQREGEIRVWFKRKTTMYKINKQQKYIIQHKEI